MTFVRLDTHNREGRRMWSCDFTYGVSSHVTAPLPIRNMYKGSEPMGRLHSVQKHMANVYLPLQFKEVKM